MKFAIIIAGTAALVSALPQSKPAAATKKLSWVKKGGVWGGTYCEFSHDRFAHTEVNCGTEIYCKAFNDQEWMKNYLRADPEFKSAEDCIDAHEPGPAAAKAKKQPWVEEGSGKGSYCVPGKWDVRCGTERYCKDFDNQRKMREDWNAEPLYSSTKECFADHEPKPLDPNRIVFPDN